MSEIGRAAFGGLENVFEPEGIAKSEPGGGGLPVLDDGRGELEV